MAEGEQVAAEVTKVTGLEYKFFTQCVVLPQGRFAEFLHATPSDRQDLLVQLLDADVYEQVRKAAVVEENRQNQAAEFARGELARLSGADEAAEKAARERAAALHDLSREVGVELERLDVLDEAVKAADAERVTVLRALAQLGALALPGEVPGLAESGRRATEQAEAAAGEQARLDDLEERADAELDALGDRAALTAELARPGRTRPPHRRRPPRPARRPTRSTVTLTEAADALDQAFRDYEEADRDLTKVRIAHAAADLARTLVQGDPCPVCHNVVTVLPGGRRRRAKRPPGTGRGRGGPRAARCSPPNAASPPSGRRDSRPAPATTVSPPRPSCSPPAPTTWPEPRRPTRSGSPPSRGCSPGSTRPPGRSPSSAGTPERPAAPPPRPPARSRRPGARPSRPGVTSTRPATPSPPSPRRPSTPATSTPPGRPR